MHTTLTDTNIQPPLTHRTLSTQTALNNLKDRKGKLFLQIVEKIIQEYS